jgi:hypothetical protein
MVLTSVLWGVHEEMQLQNLYLFGGFGLGGGLHQPSDNAMYVLNLDTWHWTRDSGHGDVPTARYSHASVAIGTPVMMAVVVVLLVAVSSTLSAT